MQPGLFPGRRHGSSFPPEIPAWQDLPVIRESGMTRIGFLVSTLLFGLLHSVSAEPLKVVVSILPQKYFVERIGGDAVEVEVLVPPGMSPHAYQPQAKQMVFLSRADLYFRIGVPFENAMMPKIADHFEGRIVDLREGITLIHADAHHHHEDENGGDADEEEFDPHFWLNPLYAVKLAGRIAETMAVLRPEDQAEFYSRRDLLIADLLELDEKLSTLLEPFRGKNLLVFHPAWGYFAERYGLHQVAIEHEGKAPSARYIGELIRDKDEQALPLLLVQPQFDHRVAQTIATELDMEIAQADPLAEDYLANLEHLATIIAGLSPAVTH